MELSNAVCVCVHSGRGGSCKGGSVIYCMVCVCVCVCVSAANVV